MAFPINRLFLHYFDPHYLEELRVSPISGKAYAEARLATRLALVASSEVLVPVASVVENEVCRSILAPFSDLFDDGTIRMIGGSSNLDTYLAAKLLQYEPGSSNYAAYEQARRQTDIEQPAYLRRHNSTTRDLIQEWILTGPAVLRGLHARTIDTAWVKSVERRWEELPAELDGRAFVPSYVAPLLLDFDHDPARREMASEGVAQFINRAYFDSFSREFSAGVLTDLVFLGTHRPNADVQVLPFRALREELREAGLLQTVAEAPAQELRSLHRDPRFQRAIIVAMGRHVPAIPASLVLPLTGLRPATDELVATKSGKATAHTYAKRIRTLLEVLFSGSLAGAHEEAPINEGRKRIDIVFANSARSGVLSWARQTYDARVVVVECKNYTESDPKNPEFDQLAMRLGRHYTRFGMLAVRKIKDLDAALARCRDAHRSHDVLMIPIEDKILIELTDRAQDPGLLPLTDDHPLSRRILSVLRSS